MAKFWTRRTEQGALLVAEDQLTDDAIAKRLSITRATLENWKRRPEFAARVDEHRAAFAEAIKGRGIAELQNRVDALNERWGLMRQVIAARAADESMKGAGHETGLLVRTYKQSKSGRPIEEYRFDQALLAELRAHEEQAAKELGQWTEKRDVTSGGKPLDLASLVLAARQGAADADAAG